MKQPIVFFVIALLAMVAFLFVKNSFNGKNELLQQNSIISQPTDISDNSFSLSNIKVGDKIVEMKVQSITPYDEGVKTLPLKSNAKVNFKGQTAITGTYYYECPGFEGKCGDSERRVCFKDLDEVSQKKMPILQNGRNSIWFCFSNASEAKNLLVPGTGKKTIVIDNYTVNVYPSEVIDTADLIKVE